MGRPTEKSKLKAAMRRRILQFWESEVADHEAAAAKGLQVSGVFIDSKDGQPWIILVCRHDTDTQGIEDLARQHFGDFLFKIVYYDKHPHACISAGGPIADALGGFGTLGGFFTTSSNGPIIGITNNHVLSGCGQRQAGEVVTDTFGNPIGRILFVANLVDPPLSNVADVALLELDPGAKGIWQPRNPTGFTGGREGMAVIKQGANDTAPTNGVIQSPPVGMVRIELCDKSFNFRNVIAIRGVNGPFSARGDSGSIVMTPNGRIIGLLFAILGDFSYAIPWSAIAAFNLQIAL